jgi:hypothetical protein
MRYEEVLRTDKLYSTIQLDRVIAAVVAEI